MSLLDDIKGQGRKPGGQCTIGLMLSSMGKPDRADLEAAFDDRDITGAQIVRALAKRGIRVQAQTLLRHRAQECACDKS